MESDSTDLSKLYRYFVQYRKNYLGDGEIPLSGGGVEHGRMREIIDFRWAFIKKPSMLFGYLLNPAMYDDDSMSITDRRDAARQLREYTMAFFSDQQDQVNCVRQYVKYNDILATMGLGEKSEIQGMKPREYWSQFGHLEYPLLAQIALRTYQIPTSSAASERVWKVFSFIHSKRRNRLKSAKVEKLAYIYVNAALLDEKDSLDYLLDQADLTGGLSDSGEDE